MQKTLEMGVPPLGWEDPLEEGMATHSSILAWRIPWTEELVRLQIIESLRVRHDCSNLAHTHTIALQRCVSLCCTTMWLTYRHTYTPSLLDLPPTPPSHPSKAITERQAELPVLQSSFPLAICFKQEYIDVSATQFIPLSPPTPHAPMSTCLFSTSASSFLPWKKAHQYHFSRFPMYVLIYMMSVSFFLT